MVTFRMGGYIFVSCLINVALAVYIRSPAAYEALKSFEVLQFPCRDTLQRYTGAFLHDPGLHSSCIEAQFAQILLHCQQRFSKGKKESLKDGVIIYLMKSKVSIV